jgi:hypothetical protein
MVHDHYGKTFPDWVPNAIPNINPPLPIVSPQEAAELRALIKGFREAVQAAKTVDRLTGQPDCLDPEKAKLETRVAELERRLDAMAKAAGA